MSDLTSIQDVFARQIPKLQHDARFHFRKLPPEAQQESIQNSIALAWKFFLSLYRKGRADEPGLLNACLKYAVRQTRSGRTVQGKNRAKDIGDLRRTGKVKFVMIDFDDFVARNTPVLDVVSFRQDIPAFFTTLNNRQQKIAIDLAQGFSTGEVAKKFNVTAGAISQFRTRFKRLYDAFFAE